MHRQRRRQANRRHEVADHVLRRRYARRLCAHARLAGQLPTVIDPERRCDDDRRERKRLIDRQRLRARGDVARMWGATAVAVITRAA